ncbi:MAG: hypothetical protein RLZZ352_1657 [Pseudomonadota bacterium]|jgi:nicotinamide riboside kinase
MALTIALLGGESSGKSSLATALGQHLNQVGIPTVVVPEHLRHWCARMGRAPHQHEQAALAAQQNQDIASACQPGVRVVVADTTALMVATYSELYFKDHSLYPAALAQQQGYDLHLLMGLDLPWVPDGLFRDSPALREATDTALRRTLQSAHIPFQTVYGQGDTRLQNALRSIGPRLGQTLLPPDDSLSTGRVTWHCETCSDPVCEHRLFTNLLTTRAR